jgi:hypothetical protein
MALGVLSVEIIVVVLFISGEAVSRKFNNNFLSKNEKPGFDSPQCPLIIFIDIRIKHEKIMQKKEMCSL